MYLVGAAHPHKADAQRLLEGAVASGDRLVTDAEVLQEILHRYVAINRRDAIQPAFDAVNDLVDEVFSITPVDVERAKASCSATAASPRATPFARRSWSANGSSASLSFDSGFDSLSGVVRLGR